MKYHGVHVTRQVSTHMPEGVAYVLRERDRYRIVSRERLTTPTALKVLRRALERHGEQMGTPEGAEVRITQARGGLIP